MAYKSFKNHTLEKRGLALLGDMILPIKTLILGDETIIDIIKSKTKRFPIKPTKRRITGIERNQLQQEYKDLKLDDTILFISEVDTASSDAFETDEKNKTIAKYLGQIVMFLDTEVLNEDGKNMWEDLEIEKKDYIALAEYFIKEIRPSIDDVNGFLEEVSRLARGEKTLAKAREEIIESIKEADVK